MDISVRKKIMDSHDKVDDVDHNEKDDNAILWVDLSPSRHLLPFSHLDSQKSEQYAPLFASNHISYHYLQQIF